MYRILVADDEPIERMVLCRKLTKHYQNQIEVYQAENGRRAMELYQEHKCEIALLDIEMPGVNGLEAAAWIRERDSRCCIIFLTAFDEFSYAKKAIGVRALDYLLKPGSDDELIAALDEAMHIAESVDIQPERQVKMLFHEKTDIPFGKAARGNINQKIIIEYIQNHYTDDISLQDAAKALNYVDAYFCRLFRQYFKKSFTTYLAEYRVEKAKLLLADITANVKEVGERVGYFDSSYFTKVFKRITGMTPSEYRYQLLEELTASN